MVARTRLIGLREPTALASTFFTPTASSTARIAPPAITPVPSDAGCMNTRAAPWLALTGCHSVPLFRSTLTCLAGVFHRLLDGDRHFARLAVAEADLAGAVAHHRQRGEGELATALDGLADAVDGDQLLDHAVVFPRDRGSCSLPFLLDLKDLRLARLWLWYADVSGGTRLRPALPLWWLAPGAASMPHAFNQNCRPPSRAASASALMRPW
jgi:hypothetical protein